MLRGGGGGWRRQASEGAEKDGRAWGRSRGGGGVAGREGSRKGWATPAATRLRFKTESRGAVFLHQMIASLPRIEDPGACTMHLMKECVTEVEEAHLKVTLSYVHKLG